LGPDFGLRYRCQNRKAFAQEVFEGRVDARNGKTSEDQRAAGCYLDSIEARAQLLGSGIEQLPAMRNADRMSFPIILPVMIAADDRTIAALGVTQRVATVRAKVFEPPDLVAKALHEY
jgi:hypothetical protein